jgi:hypothetical protein
LWQQHCQQRNGALFVSSAEAADRLADERHVTQILCITTVPTPTVNTSSRLKGEVHTRIGREGPGGRYRCTFTFYLTSALDGVRGQRHAPRRFTPVDDTRYSVSSSP